MANPRQAKNLMGSSGLGIPHPLEEAQPRVPPEYWDEAIKLLGRSPETDGDIMTTEAVARHLMGQDYSMNSTDTSGSLDNLLSKIGAR